MWSCVCPQDAAVPSGNRASYQGQTSLCWLGGRRQLSMVTWSSSEILSLSPVPTVIRWVFPGFSFSLLLLIQSLTSVQSLVSDWLISITVLAVAVMVVSSAYESTSFSSVGGRSLKKIKKRRGPRMLPCGTPTSHCAKSEST